MIPAVPAGRAESPAVSSKTINVYDLDTTGFLHTDLKKFLAK